MIKEYWAEKFDFVASVKKTKTISPDNICLCILVTFFMYKNKLCLFFSFDDL